MPAPVSSNIDWIYLVDAEPYDPALAGTVTIRLSTRPVFFDATDPDSPNTVYRAWLTEALTCNRSMIGASMLGGPALPTQAAITGAVGDEFAADRAYWKTLRWGGWNVTIRRIAKGAAFATAQILLRGQFAAEPDFQKTKFSIPVGDLGVKLQAIFARATYGGTGGFDGGSDIAGQYKPDAVGAVFGVEGTWVDPANGWMDFCASGFASAPSKVTDGANVMDADPTNPPDAGKYYVDTINGRLRFGSPATFSYRADFVSGFATGSTKIGGITAALLTRAGYAAGDIDSAAFTALDSARTEKVGWFCNNGETFQDVVNAIVAESFCYLTANPSDSGKLTIGQVLPPDVSGPTDPGVALIITDRDIIPDSFKRTGAKAPPWRLDIKAQRNWKVLDDGRLAGGATTADKNFAREEWRTVPKTNSTTQVEFPLSVPLEIQTAFADLGEVSTLGDIWKLIFTVPQPTAEVSIAAAPFALPLGATVWISSAVNEVEAPAIVGGIEENAGGSQVKLQLWALTEP